MAIPSVKKKKNQIKEHLNLGVTSCAHLKDGRLFSAGMDAACMVWDAKFIIIFSNLIFNL